MECEQRTSAGEEGSVAFGLIGAMSSEVALLREAMDGAQACTIGGREYVRGMIDRVSCVVVQCGVGMVNAAACTQALIDHFGVACVINTGVAGSLDDSVGIGDVVVGTDAVNWMMDVQNLGYAPGQTPGESQVGIPLSDTLRAQAVRAAHAEGIVVHEGRIASGDRFVREVQEKNHIAGVFGAACCEMEGAAVTQVCALNDVPCAILRAISDTADGHNADDYDAFEVEAARRCAAITRHLVAAAR